MILAEIKKEEYRDVSDYWIKRLKDVSSTDPKAFKEFDTITFSNGYSKKRPQFEIELKGIRIGEGKTEWGAIPETKYFILELGDIIQRNTGLDTFISCQ